MTATVYTITHRDSGRQYVGQTGKPVTQRWSGHISSAERRPVGPITFAIRKHGSRAFDFQVLATLPTAAEAKIAERLAIACMRPAFNATAGGDGTHGMRHKPETLKRFSEIARAQQRQPPPGVGTAAALLVHTGAKRTAETRAKMSMAQRKRFGVLDETQEQKLARQIAWRRSYYAENRLRILRAKEQQRRADGAQCRKPAGVPWRSQ